MVEKEVTLNDLAKAIAENTQAIETVARATSENTEMLHGFIGYAEGRFEKIDERFEKIDHDLNEFKQETAESFRQVHKEIADLREISFPLDEQSEVRLRLHRVEDHLGLSHEVV